MTHATLDAPERRIPLVDLALQHAPLETALSEAFGRVLRSGRFVLGSEVASFEREVAAFLGVEHAVGVSSGSDALVCALRALDLRPGDEVITTPFTFVATAEAIVRAGATPRFADVDEQTLQLSPASVKAAITPRTRAVVVVHLYGHVAPLVELVELAKRHGLALVEDAAQAFGAALAGRRLGGFGALGCFSFFPSKPLGALGDAGLVVTRDAAFAERCRDLRAHGARRRQRYERVGGNFRLDELQAAALRVKLPHCDAWRAGRERIARRYDELLADVRSVVLPAWSSAESPAFGVYTVRVPAHRRDALIAHLDARGIDTAVYYRRPLHLEPAFTRPEHRAGCCPAAERAAGEVLSLPIFAELGDAGAERVAGALRDFFA